MPTTPSLHIPDLESARAGFRDAYGRDAEIAWLAPGRVNLIGEHTDYNDGFVLPLAIPAGCLALVAATDTGVVRIASAQEDDTAQAEVDGLAPGDVDGWARYVAGVVWALAEAGKPVAGVDIYVDGNVPGGAGLSSSAALECCVVGALDALFALNCSAEERVAVARKAENDYVGAPTGGMDQLISVGGQTGHVLLCDMRSLEVEAVPFDLAAAGLALLVVDTRAAHELVSGEYGERRASCEKAAALLGVPALRDIALGDLDVALEKLRSDGGEDAETIVKRARHVVTEDARVLETVELLRRGEFRAIGDAMLASHTSMRDDFEITVPEVDLAVTTAVTQDGVIGSRMTGGGFGGCVISVVEADVVDAVADAVVTAFADAGFDAPVCFTATATEGARAAG
jgi:galactokinase